MMKLIVVEAHKSNYPDPIHFQKGDRLMIAKRDTEFKGWIWVTTKDGNQGWAPVQYLQIIDERKAVAKQNYTAVELDTCAGDELLLHDEVNGWGWVEKKDGSSGWVPMNTTKLHSDSI
ncbi:MAG: SH3 domain-containing protein [Desulfobacterales bacterium]|nr:SH3 domain-containing protein [Desulfobacterales bacterium]